MKMARSPSMAAGGCRKNLAKIEGLMTGRLAIPSAVVLFCFGGIVAVHGQGAEGPVGESLTFHLDAARPVAVPPRPWVGRVVGIPGPAGVEKSAGGGGIRSEEHTSELQSHSDLVCRLLLEKKKQKQNRKASDSRQLQVV